MVPAPPPVAFNKFNSLDRRTLARRHQPAGGQFKIYPSSSNATTTTVSFNSGSESLPVSHLGTNPQQHQQHQQQVVANKEVPQPERRHSSYGSRYRTNDVARYVFSPGYLLALSDPSRSNSLDRFPSTQTKNSDSRLNAMNINGLPDPFTNTQQSSMARYKIRRRGSCTRDHRMNLRIYLYSCRTHPNVIYSSQDSLNYRPVNIIRTGNTSSTVTPSSHNSINQPHQSGHRSSGAGTPQFQNLSGVVRSGRGSLTNINSVTINTNGHSHHHYHGGIRPLNDNSNHSNRTMTSASTTENANSNSSTTTINPNSSGSSNSSSRGSNHSSNCIMQTANDDTPSPSDSAVGDLESMLKEKDTEINYLRETMEQNEQVIFKVPGDSPRYLSSPLVAGT